MESRSYNALLHQRDLVDNVIEEVVTFEHGGLNTSVDTMSDVVKEYNKGRDEIQTLRSSLQETTNVLLSKKSGQITLRELWAKKVELEESLRILGEVETLRDAPLRVQRMVQQRRYLSAVTVLTRAIRIMFGEDVVGVMALGQVQMCRNQTVSPYD
jgi:exocyst complex component 4